MPTVLTIDFPARPDCDSTWCKDQVEEQMKSSSCTPENEIAWMHWALVEALGDACDPKEIAPLNMFVENDLVTSLTINFADGPCKITKL